MVLSSGILFGSFGLAKRLEYEKNITQYHKNNSNPNPTNLEGTHFHVSHEVLDRVSLDVGSLDALTDDRDQGSGGHGIRTRLNNSTVRPGKDLVLEVDEEGGLFILVKLLGCSC